MENRELMQPGASLCGAPAGPLKLRLRVFPVKMQTVSPCPVGLLWHPWVPRHHFGNHSLGCTMQCPVLNDLCSKLLVIHGNVGMERQPRKHFSHLTQDVSSD